MVDLTELAITKQTQWAISRLSSQQVGQLKDELRHTFSEHYHHQKIDREVTDDMAAFFLRTTVRTMLQNPWIGEDIKSLEEDKGFDIFIKIYYRIKKLTDDQKSGFTKRYEANHLDRPLS